VTLSEIAVLAAEALDGAREHLEADEREAAATYAFVSIAASLYLLGARDAAPSPITSSR